MVAARSSRASVTVNVKPKEAERIQAFSLDADGCLFNPKYIALRKSNRSVNAVVDSNPNLVEHITQKVGTNESPAVFLVGSNRQSYNVDKRNANRNDTQLITEGLPEFVNHIDSLTKRKAIIDKYLLADSFNEGLLPGSCFDSKEAKNDCFLEKEKILLLYAQMHRLAASNPNKQIDFYFYDDREDILEALHKYYSEHCDYIPRNVKLHLNQYGSNIPNLDLNAPSFSVNSYKPIQGTGNIDHQYGKTIKDVANSYFENKTKSMLAAKGGVAEDEELYRSTLSSIKLTEIVDGPKIWNDSFFRTLQPRPQPQVSFVDKLAGIVGGIIFGAFIGAGIAAALIFAPITLTVVLVSGIIGGCAFLGGVGGYKVATSPLPVVTVSQVAPTPTPTVNSPPVGVAGSSERYIGNRLSAPAVAVGESKGVAPVGAATLSPGDEGGPKRGSSQVSYAEHTFASGASSLAAPLDDEGASDSDVDVYEDAQAYKGRPAAALSESPVAAGNAVAAVPEPVASSPAP